MAGPNGSQGSSVRSGAGPDERLQDAGGTDTAQIGADSQGTPAPEPAGKSGQSANHTQATGTGTATQAPGAGSGNGEDSFFDPETIKGTPLEGRYKEMQGAFTKRMQEAKKLLSTNQGKISAYDEFMQNPEQNLRNLAQQVGFTLVKGQPENQGEPWQPKTWDDVISHVTEQVRNEFTQEMRPIVGEVQKLRQQSVEQYLDSNFDDWREYEDAMMDNLVQHPTLVNDPQMLYRMTVPSEVIEQRMMKQAMQKLQARDETNQLPGPGTRTTTDSKDSGLSEVKTFQDAVRWAEQKLAKRGVKKPAEG